MKKIWLVAATQAEIKPLSDTYNFKSVKDRNISFSNKKRDMLILITGVGMYNTIYSMMDALSEETPDLIINAGIAGSFRKDIAPGSVVSVREDRFADIGAEDKDGSFMSIFDMGFEDTETSPFTQGKLLSSDVVFFDKLQSVKGITVNKVHGFKRSILAVQSQYDPDIESMEGAAVMFTALKKGIPVIQIRSVSNYVTPRNKNEWKIGLAIQNLNHTLSEFVQKHF